jgi:hypothetical protein
VLKRPQLSASSLGTSRSGKVASLDPSTFENPIDAVLTTCKKYLLGESLGVEDAFCKKTKDRLLIGIDSRRYTLGPIRDDSHTAIDLPTGLYSINVLLNLELRKPNPIISDLIYEGETVLLGGRPKVGKSRLIHQALLSLSYATPFLGMTVPCKRRVLLIDLENRPWSIKDRLERMASPGSADIETAYVWCSDSLAENAVTSKPEGIKKLEALLDDTDADVLMIDPWRLWLGGDENSSEEIVRGLTALSQLRKSRPALTIIIVHHVRKERFESPARLLRDPSLWIENISGHHALVSHVDACYGLDRQEHEGEEIVTFGGAARNVEPRTLLLNDDPQSLRFDVAANEASALATMTEREKNVFEKLKSMPGRFTWTQALAAADTLNKKLVSSVLKKAEGHGLIKKSDNSYQIVKPSHRN